jgi:shikimate dehydrogenase
MKIYGLIGYPLGHSFSAGYFKEKFNRENINNCIYRNFPIESAGMLPDIISATPELVGLNVTIPHKQKVIPFLDEIFSPARNINAVNTIKIDRVGEDIFLKGYNTDIHGFWSSIENHLPDGLENALILGSGGASAAVKYALENHGINTIVVSRNPSADSLSYSQLDRRILESNRLIVNTTPLGTYPDTEEAPEIPYRFLSSSHLLYDLVYNPAETHFMKLGSENGAKVKNGYEMLVNQAEKSWEIWNS